MPECGLGPCGEFAGPVLCEHWGAGAGSRLRAAPAWQQPERGQEEISRIPEEACAVWRTGPPGKREAGDPLKDKP